MTRSEIAAKTAASAARKARRAQKAVENAALKGEPVIAPGPLAGSGTALEGPRTRGTRLDGRKATPRPAKRRESPSLSKLKKILWDEMSLLVRSWSDTCIVPECFSPTQCAAHIVPSHEGAATRFFLPNLYPCCNPHNDAERHRRATWVKKHEEMFGVDFVDALYQLAKTVFPLKKWWVLEQTVRIKNLREAHGR